MSELEEPTELATEIMLESTQEDEAESVRKKWHSQVALSTLVLALLVAVGALFTGITANEALLERTKEALEVSTMQGDQLKVEVLKAKHEILRSIGAIPDETEIQQIIAYEQEVNECKQGIANEEGSVLVSIQLHLIFAVGVMLLSIGISLSGMSVIVDRKWLWIAGLIIGLAGVAVIGIGIVRMVA